MASPKALIQEHRLLIGLAIFVFALDQVTKIWVMEYSGFSLGLYPPYSGTEIIPGVFNLVYTVNYGAAWGMFEGFGWLLAILAIVIIGAIIYFHQAFELERRSHQIAFGLIIGGIVGNTVDRLLHGHVVDFLDFDLQFYRWPTFNVADCGIVCGTILYLILSWKPESKKKA